MKKTLALLLITVSTICQAQKYDKTKPLIIFKDSSGYVDVALSVQDYIKYGIECYNDSTLVGNKEKCCKCDDHNCNEDETFSICHEHFVRLWTHKTPTFEGFIYYLENKYKIK